MLFDQRVKTLHDFGASPHNFIAFNPQSRLVALAGFGNLAGKIDIFDRRTLSKVCTIDAPNTSYCEWSPDGRFLLTATLSPRLRVDNGVKIWHCSGPLIHLQLTEELYQVSWRPTPVDGVAPFGQNVPPAPPASASVKDLEAVQKPALAKPAGAYRPPGARGLATPAFYKREDEGGVPHVQTNGTGTPPRGYSRSPVPPGAPGYGQNGHHNGYQGNGNGRRHVPGAAHSPSPGPDVEKKGNRKRKTGKKEGGEGEGEGQVNGEGQGQGQNRQAKGNKKVNVNTPVPPPVLAVPEPETPTTPGIDGLLDLVAKKVRNLNKKVSFLFLILPSP